MHITTGFVLLNGAATEMFGFVLFGRMTPPPLPSPRPAGRGRAARAAPQPEGSGPGPAPRGHAPLPPRAGGGARGNGRVPAWPRPLSGPPERREGPERGRGDATAAGGSAQCPRLPAERERWRPPGGAGGEGAGGDGRGCGGLPCDFFSFSAPSQPRPLPGPREVRRAVGAQQRGEGAAGAGRGRRKREGGGGEQGPAPARAGGGLALTASGFPPAGRPAVERSCGHRPGGPVLGAQCPVPMLGARAERGPAGQCRAGARPSGVGRGRRAGTRAGPVPPRRAEPGPARFKAVRARPDRSAPTQLSGT